MRAMPESRPAPGVSGGRRPTVINDKFNIPPDLLARLEAAVQERGAKRVGDEVYFLCPLHDDHDPSARWNPAKRTFYCDICKRGGGAKKLAKLLDIEVPQPNARRIVAVYPYKDEKGELLFEVVRYESKRFKQRRPDGNGGWVWNLNGCRRVLYNLPGVLAAVAAGETVWVVEGEKDADNLGRVGLTATTNPGGAGNWRDEYSGELRGVRVVILPDNDGPGHEHAQAVAQRLQGVAAEVRTLHLPGLPEKADVTDFLAELEAEGKDSEAIRATLEARAAETAVADVAAPDEGQPEGGDNPFRASRASPAGPELPDEALHGVAGAFVAAVMPSTEADPAAILLQVLVGFGNMAGRGAHVRVERDLHYLNEFCVLVGATSRSRKGSSSGRVFELWRQVDPKWVKNCVVDGLSSGEGLIAAVAGDDGTDKRLLVHQGEFGGVLQVLQRQGNTLSAVLRNAWDGRELRTLTRHEPLRGVDHLISLVGHITEAELHQQLHAIEAWNGLGNRILWACVRRSKSLPRGGGAVCVDGFVGQLKAALAFAREERELHFDDEAGAQWDAIYPVLTRDEDGLVGALLARAEAHVLRLAAIYAALDCSALIRTGHLMAALAVWQFCEESVFYTFGDSTGDAVADKLLQLLGDHPEGLARAEIGNAFSRHQKNLDEHLGKLARAGLALCEKRPTGGRPVEIWSPTPGAKSAQSAIAYVELARAALKDDDGPNGPLPY